MAQPRHEVKAVDLAEVALGTGQDLQKDPALADQVLEKDQVREVARVQGVAQVQETDPEVLSDQERGQVLERDQDQQGLERDLAQQDQVQQGPVQEHVQAQEKEVEAPRDLEVLLNQDLKHKVVLVLGKGLVLHEVVHHQPLDLHKGVLAQNLDQDKKVESAQLHDHSPLPKKHQAQQRPQEVEVEEDQAAQDLKAQAQAQEVEALRALNVLNLHGKVVIRDPSHPKIPKVQGVQRVLVVPSLLVNPNLLQPLNHQKNQNSKRMNQKEKERRKMSVLLRTRTKTSTPAPKKKRTKKFLV